MRIPKRKSAIVTTAVSIADIYPTLLNLIQEPVPQHSQGVSLFDEEGLAARQWIPGSMVRGSSLKYRQNSIINGDGVKLLGKRCIPFRTPLECDEFELLDAKQPLDVPLDDTSLTASMTELLRSSVEETKNSLISCAYDFQLLALDDYEKMIAPQAIAPPPQ